MKRRYVQHITLHVATSTLIILVSDRYYITRDTSTGYYLAKTRDADKVIGCCHSTKDCMMVFGKYDAR